MGKKVLSGVCGTIGCQGLFVVKKGCGYFLAKVGFLRVAPGDEDK